LFSPEGRGGEVALPDAYMLGMGFLFRLDVFCTIRPVEGVQEEAE
jgi:hypothetical protein